MRPKLVEQRLPTLPMQALDHHSVDTAACVRVTLKGTWKKPSKRKFFASGN
jgi:hypothetical protein